MSTLKKITAVLFAILFISSAVPALILFNFDRKGFTAETYQKAFARNDFYEKLPAVMAKAVTATNDGQNNFPIVMPKTSQAAWEVFFRTLLPQETLKAMGDDVLISTFAYVNRQQDSAKLTLTPLKDSLVSDTGVQAVFTLLKTQSDCTLLQIGQMTLNLLNQSQIQLCNPPQEIIPLLTPVIQGQLQVAALAIPDQVTLISAPSHDDPRNKLQIARWAMRLSPLLPLGFLFLLTIVAVGSIKSWLIWLGVPFAATGGVATLMSLIGAPIFGAILERILIARMPDYLPAILLAYASNLATAMLNAILGSVFWQGLIIGFLGAVMVLVSLLLALLQHQGGKSI